MDPSSQANQQFQATSSATEELYRIVEEIETFLLQWSADVQEDLSQCKFTAASDAILRKRLADFRQEKNQWEAKKSRELSELEDKAKTLTDAWLRLEQEQRLWTSGEPANRNLAGSASEVTRQARSGAALSSEATAAVPAAAETRAAEAVNADSVAATGVRKRSANPLSPNHEREGTSSRAAVAQFQQLRREIRSLRSH